MKKRICLLITCFSFMSAYSANHKVTGSIKDIEQNSIPAATIRILAPDSSFVKGSVTDEKGESCLDNIKKGKYILSASCIGYTNRFLDFEMPDKDYELPTVILEENNVMLEGVTVTGASVIQKKDHLLIIPDKQQVKHAYTGYDLLYNLMIPGITVERRQKTVSTSRGQATLYINGVKADFREVQNLRPKDIERIEFFEMPTGQYLGDAASINYITKEYKTGGYISLDGEQLFGYLSGDYNIASKTSHHNTDYLLFAGYNMKKYDGTDTEKEEMFALDVPVYRNASTEDASYKNNQQYVQFKVNNSNSKRTLSGSVSFVHNQTPHNDLGELLTYTSETGNQAIRSAETTSQKNYKPAVSLDGTFYPSDRQRLHILLNSSYSRNEYLRNYTEQERMYNTDVNEDLYSVSAIGIYNIKLRHHNSIGGNIQHYQNITSSEYTGNTLSSQYLRMGETMAFLSYTQDIGKKFTFMVSPGVSLLRYKLNHNNEDKHSFWNFRTNVGLRYQFTPKHQLFLSMAIGNEQADISYLNSVSQAVDSLQVKRGNPYLDNTKIYSYFLQYRAQVNKVNMQFELKYMTYPNHISYDYFVENNKLIQTYRSDNSFRKMSLSYLCSYRISDNLRANGTVKYERMSVPEYSGLKENNIFASIDVNYFIRSFAINLYARTTEQILDGTTFSFIKNPASYGLSVRYSGKNWMAEAGTENPFTRHAHYRESADYGVYRYNQVRTSRIYQQTGYVKLAYTFDFGKKTSREANNVDRSINSAILKAR